MSDLGEPLEVDTICRICEVWGDKEKGKFHGCDYCRNGYHDVCLGKEYGDTRWDTCQDLGRDCNFSEGPAFHFEFLNEINRVLKATQSKKQKEKEKKKNSKRKKQKSRRASLYGSKKYQRIYYDSCDYYTTTYKIGDDVVLAMSGGSEDVGRITQIYRDDNDTMARLSVLWFWKPSQLNGNNEDDDNNELYFDPELESDEPWEAVLGKATVVGRYEEYLKRRQKEASNEEYIYWCTHAYNSNKKKKEILPSHVIPTHITVNITPAPTKKTRKRGRKQTIEDDLEDANKALMLSAVPTKLPCREKEHDEIQRFMKCAVENEGMGSGLYISGMPGTGKTATVRQIARELKQLTNTRGRGRGKKKLPPFDFREINAMKLPTPHHIYTELCKYLLDKHYAPSTAAKKLEKYFSTKTKDRKLTVLLVDELDYLLTKRQKVIYNVFDWPTRANSKLVVIGIANTMDLPERLLPRVSSRLGLTRIVFKPYSREQLIKIVQHRLAETKVFNNDAIKYCASSVASITGDCRAVLQICRRAIDIASHSLKQNGSINIDTDHNNNNNARKRPRTRNVTKNKNNEHNHSQNEDFQISLHHIKMAKMAFDQSNDLQIVSTCSIYEKLFLTAMVMYNSHTNGIAGTMSKYRQKFNTFTETQLGESKMKNIHFQNMLNRLQDIGLITIRFNKKEWVQWIKLNVQIEDAKHALKENDICAKIISSLQT